MIIAYLTCTREGHRQPGLPGTEPSVFKLANEARDPGHLRNGMNSVVHTDTTLTTK